MSSMSVRQKELTPEQLQRIADNKAIALARKRKLEGSVEALCEHKQKRENTEPTHQPQSATVARALDEEEDSEDSDYDPEVDEVVEDEEGVSQEQDSTSLEHAQQILQSTVQDSLMHEAIKTAEAFAVARKARELLFNRVCREEGPCNMPEKIRDGPVFIQMKPTPASEVSCELRVNINCV
jgi:hypothetical protein